jgi:hypothetical protein
MVNIRHRLISLTAWVHAQYGFRNARRQILQKPNPISSIEFVHQMLNGLKLRTTHTRILSIGRGVRYRIRQPIIKNANGANDLMIESV